jgi:glycine betaine catabolism B
MQVQFKKRQPEAEHIFRFYFEALARVDYMPGQYIQLHMPHPNEDNRGIKRWFTLSSSPTEELLFITTKITDPKGSSFKQALMDLEPGQSLEMDEPEGDFVLPKDSEQRIVFVAGGIGITPFRSIIQCLNDKKLERPIQLIYAANSPRELAFRDLFDNTAAISEVKYMVRQPEGEWSGAVGLLEADKIKGLAGGIDGKLVYLSGPEPMVEKLEQALLAGGHDKALLKTDFFPNYLDI